jgi:alpha-1,2-mannosyltransferase
MRSDIFSRAPWLDATRVVAYARIFLALYVVLIAVWLGLSHGMIDRGGKPIGTDFMNVWAAGRLVLAGTPADAYDYARHYAVQRAALPWQPAQEVPYYSWHYPPMFLMVAALLALLPYGAALALWMAATLPAYLAVIRAILPDRRALLFALAFPGTFVNFGHGQNGFLTTGLFGGGLLLLERRPLLAGALFGLLSYKPQFGLLLAPALLAGRQGRAFLAAAATGILVALVSYIVFGAATWHAFFASLELARSLVLEEGAAGWDRMQSAFAATRLLGGSVAAAYAVQGATTLIVTVIVVWIWRRPVDLPLKGAALVTATVMATPYVFDYDLVLLALPIAWLAMAGIRGGFLAWEKLALLVVWLLPLIAREIGHALGLPLAPAVLACLLALIVRRAVTAPVSPPS